MRRYTLNKTHLFTTRALVTVVAIGLLLTILKKPLYLTRQRLTINY